MRPNRTTLRLIIVTAFCLAIAAASARAGTTITVNTANDELNSDGDCSLREAIRAANLDTAVDGCPAGSGADIIQLPSGTYTLNQGFGDNEAL
jgi:CSLREA domain-containing protein